MAQLSPPEWKTADGGEQVTSLPSVTVVSFKVRPRASARGFHVRYRLHSARVEFRPTADDPQIQADEVAETDPGLPPLEPVRRQLRVIEDSYPAVTTPTDVTRGLALELSGADLPAMASLDITVSDITPSGDLANPDADTVAISFNL